MDESKNKVRLKRRMWALTPKKIRKLLDRSKDLTPTQRILIDVGLRTGMRGNEILGLNIGDIDRDRCLISVHTKASIRHISIDADLVEKIFQYISPRTKGALFIHPKTGKVLNPNILNLLVRKAGEKVGIRNLTIPHLRHTCVLNMINKGLDNSQLCVRFGWKNRDSFQQFDAVQ